MTTSHSCQLYPFIGCSNPERKGFSIVNGTENICLREDCCDDMFRLHLMLVLTYGTLRSASGSFILILQGKGLASISDTWKVTYPCAVQQTEVHLRTLFK